MDIKLSKRQACFRLEQNSAFKPQCTTGCDAGTRLPRLSASISLWGNRHNSSPAFPGQVTLRRLVTAGWDACVGNWRNDRDAGLFNVKPDCFHEFEWLVVFFSPPTPQKIFGEKLKKHTHRGLDALWRCWDSPDWKRWRWNTIQIWSSTGCGEAEDTTWS